MPRTRNLLPAGALDPPWAHLTSHLAGEIDSKELKVAMRALGFEPKKEARGLSESIGWVELRAEAEGMRMEGNLQVETKTSQFRWSVWGAMVLFLSPC